jgi:hypothetical protein
LPKEITNKGELLMKKSILFISIILTLSSLVYSNENLVRYMKNSSTVFNYDSNDTAFNDKKLSKHVALFNALYQSTKLFLKGKELSALDSSSDTVSVTYDRTLKKTTYEDVKKHGIGTIKIGDDGFPRYINFNTTPSIGRGFTVEEYNLNRETNKIPPSYCSITEQQAVERARQVLNSIYGPTENGKFDSVSISGDHQEYLIDFRIKPKNDISDNRCSHISINANTGEIEGYSGDGLSDIDFSYIPQITKNQALQMYSAECTNLGADIVITDIFLSKYSNKGLRCWVWKIYGMRKDKKLSMAAMMFIDSETSEVLYKNME